MSKADLQDATTKYESCVAAALAAESHGCLKEAVDHAVQAWEFLEAMLRFSKRFRKLDVDSVHCVNLVVRLAPVLLDPEPLDTLSTLLKSRKSIDRAVSDNLAEMLAGAKRRLAAAHRIFDCIERNPEIGNDDLCSLVEIEAERVTEILGQWLRFGVVRRTSLGHAHGFRLTLDLGAIEHARCARCGRDATGEKSSFLTLRACDSCGVEQQFVILRSPSGIA